MSWVNEALGEFGATMGIDDLAFNEDGVASLTFERMGTLFLEKVDHAVLVYLVREMDRPEAKSYAFALELCHWQQNHSLAVNAALRDDRDLVFAVHLADEQVSVPNLEQAIHLLEGLHEQIREGAPA